MIIKIIIENGLFVSFASLLQKPTYRGRTKRKGDKGSRMGLSETGILSKYRHPEKFYSTFILIKTATAFPAETTLVHARSLLSIKKISSARNRPCLSNYKELLSYLKKLRVVCPQTNGFTPQKYHIYSFDTHLIQ